MSKLLERLRPSPAMAVAFIALFIGAAGTATAAKLITGRQIKNSTITSSDVKNGSLLLKDFRKGQAAAGPPGAPGRPGRDGFGVLSYPSEVALVGNTEGGSLFVDCPPGQYPTGGDVAAFDTSADQNLVTTSNVILFDGFSTDDANRPNGWAAEIQNTSGAERVVLVEAICANAGQPPSPLSAAKAKRRAPRGRSLR